VHYRNQVDFADSGLFPTMLGQYRVQGGLTGSYAIDLWQPGSIEHPRRLRLTLAAHTEASYLHPYSSSTRYSLRLSASLQLRTRWCLVGFRLSAGEGWVDLDR